MNSEFPQTRLSILQQIQNGNDEERKTALELFIESYGPALVSFLIRCKKVPEAQAEDLVQDFMINKVMSGKVLNHDSGKGRFRNLLRVALQRDFLDQIEKNKRERIEGSLDPDQQCEPQMEHEDFIDQAWAVAVFSSALSKLKASSDHWGVFSDRVLTQPPVGYEEIIKKYNYESPEKASNFLMTSKRAFNRILNECIQEQSSWTTAGHSEDELKEEIEFLRASLSNPQLLREAIGSVGEPVEKLSSSRRELSDSLVGQQFSFIEESNDANWDSSDTSAILNHLLLQPLDSFGVPQATPQSIGDFIASRDSDPQNLRDAKNLKTFFSNCAKSGQSSLPYQIDVTMTFVSIACYIVAGGHQSEITSLGPHDLASRLGMLANKDWIPASISALLLRAIEVCRK